MSRVIKPQPRERPKGHATFDPTDGHWSDLDYSPDQELIVKTYKAALPLQARRKIDRLRASPSPLRSSVSLGEVRHETQPRSAAKKGKGRARCSPSPVRDDAPQTLAQSEFPLINDYEDSGYVSDSADTSSALAPEEDEKKGWDEPVEYENYHEAWGPAYSESISSHEAKDEDEDEGEKYQDEGEEHQDEREEYQDEGGEYQDEGEEYQDECEQIFSNNGDEDEDEDDRRIETMMDVDRYSESSKVPRSSRETSPIPELPIQVQFRNSYVYPRRGASQQGGSSRGPGTMSWHTARGHKYSTSTSVPSERTQSNDPGKQVMFAAEEDSPEPEPSSSSRMPPNSSPNSVLSARYITTPSDRRPLSVRRDVASLRSASGSRGADANEWFAEFEADLSQMPQTPRRTRIAQALPKSSDMAFISRIGLGVVLEALGTKYGLHPDVVERVYNAEEGIQATEEVLKEMKGHIDEILYRRASSAAREDSG